MKAGILSLSRLYARAKESRFSRNVLWNVLGGVTSKITGPIFAILVARLIEPRDYGVFAIGVAVAAFFQIGKDLGLSQAIIVDDKNDEHLSLQFTVQLSWACLVYAVLYVLSPYVALAYGDAPELVSVLRILGLGFFVAAVVDPYATHHLKQQNYRFLFIRQVVPTVVGGILMLVLAHQGHGVYALVAGTLSSAIAAALVMAWGAGVLPRLTVNWPLLRRLFRLGKHITLQEFAGYLVQQADSIIVGRNLGPAMAGLYKIGNTIALIIPNSISSQIQQVVFTDMAERRKDPDFMVRRNGSNPFEWYLLERDGGGTGASPILWGSPGDVMTPGDYDGDGKQDVAIWRPDADPTMNFFYVRRSSDMMLQTYEWGSGNDFAVPGWIVN